MRINIHAGHNPDGMPACGAVGLIRESTEARAVKDRVVAQLTAMGHTVHDCTCNNGTGKQDVLKRIAAACNAHAVDLDVSIHFNAAANPEPDGKTTGTEVLVYDNASPAVPWAQQIADSIAALGYRNRGVKERPNLYVLKHTKAPALLIECCFVDDPDDVHRAACGGRHADIRYLGKRDCSTVYLGVWLWQVGAGSAGTEPGRDESGAVW